MEGLLSYFGEYTADTIGSLGTFKFDYLCALAFAAIIIILGRWIVKHVPFLKRYGFPAPVVGGIIFSIVVALFRVLHIVDFRFETTFMRDLLQNIFFLCVGFSFSTKVLQKSGGKLIIMIVVTTCVLITLQGAVGIVVALAMGRNPLMGLICSAGAMSGGVGTASAFGPIYEGWGLANATALGVAAGVIGNIMGSVIGGPVAALLIKRHDLNADPNDLRAEEQEDTKTEVHSDHLIIALAVILVLAGCGKVLCLLMNLVPFLDMPTFVGCIFAGAIGRNVMEAIGMDIHLPEMDAIQDMSLEVYLALVLMGTNFVDLVPFAGVLAVMLLSQALLIFLLGYFWIYRVLGHNYSSACMTAGAIGWGCGSGTNAIANEKAIMEQYGYDSVAAEVYPSFAVILSDIYDPLFLSVVGGLFRA